VGKGVEETEEEVEAFEGVEGVERGGSCEEGRFRAGLANST
jgi:hypothetical protein